MSIYDWFALGQHCRFVWQCPSTDILAFYNQHVSGNHLDVGIGTGYFLDRCRFPVERPRLVLADVNPDILLRVKKRLKRYDPLVYHRDILEPLCLDTPGFDSVGLSLLLHCLPGNMDTKGKAFENVMPLLNAGGVLFGSTLLYEGVRRNPLATFTFWWANRLGFMSSRQDSLEGLDRSLKKYFSSSHIEVRGCAALFWARK